ICQELDEAVAVARTKGQAQAMVSAVSLRAKLAGLLTDRLEVTASITEAFEAATSLEDIVDSIASTKGFVLAPQERPGLIKILNEWDAAMNEYLAGCKAKPVGPVMSAVNSN